MEKKTIMEVIKDNKETIIKRALIVLGTIGGLLLVSKVLTGDDNEMETLVDSEEEPQDVEFSEVENEEEK